MADFALNGIAFGPLTALAAFDLVATGQVHA